MGTISHVNKIANFSKGKDIIRPMGSTRIDEGDVVAIFALAGDVPEVERLMQVSIDFF